MKRKILAFIIIISMLLSMLPVHMAADSGDGIYINELCADNKTVIKDANGVYSDWIEIYNDNDFEVNLGGYGLSDKVNSPFLWVFPDVTIPAKGFLTVFASNEDTVIAGELHTNFALSKSGETVILTALSESISDRVDFPALRDDEAWGRLPDGGNDFAVIVPSPGVSNTGAEVLPPIIEPPVFSVESGFYDKPFELHITAEPGMKVLYTLDGSDPTPESDEYTAGIMVRDRKNDDNIYSVIRDISILEKDADFPSFKVDKCMIVRAVSCDGEGNLSGIATQSYFVGLDKDAKYPGVPVISLVTDPQNLFDYEKGIYRRGKPYQDWLAAGGNPNRTEFWLPANYNMKGSEWERPAHIDFFEDDGSLGFSQNVGIRVRGNFSACFTQKSFNIYARGEYGEKTIDYELLPDRRTEKGERITSYKSFTLRNGGNHTSLLKFFDSMMQEFHFDRSFSTQGSRASVLFLDGEYWGVVYIIEKYTQHYLNTHYGVDPDNVSIIKNGELNEGTAADLKKYRDDLGWFNSVDMTVEENYREFCNRVDVDNLIDYFAAEIAIGNADWPGNNFAAWRMNVITDKPYEDGKWRFLMFDTDNSNIANVSGGLGNDWMRSALKNSEFRQKFITSIMDINNVNLATRRVNSIFYRYAYELYGIMEDNMRRFNTGSWNPPLAAMDDAILKLPASLATRRMALPKRLAEYFSLAPEVDVTMDITSPEMGEVTINTAKPDLSKGLWAGQYFTEYPITVSAKANSGYVFTGWTVTDSMLADGFDEADSTVSIILSGEGADIKANFKADTSTQGTKTNPYQISSADDLAQMRSMEDYYGKHFVLTGDIVLPDSFISIGTAANPFNGSFDGKGHKITGMNINSNVQGQGLFGYVGADGVVENVGVINCVISGDKNIGAIAGNNGGLIKNCYSTGTLSGASTVGGIAGNNKGGTIKNCFSLCDVQSTSENTRGGIAGKTESGGEVVNSYSVITPVAKNDGGYVDFLTASMPLAAFENGEVAYMLNEKGKNTLWSVSGANTIFADDHNKAVVVKVTFMSGGGNNTYRYTYIGGNVDVPHTDTKWLLDGVEFTAASTVTKDIYVIKEGSGAAAPQPLPARPNVEPDANVFLLHPENPFQFPHTGTIEKEGSVSYNLGGRSGYHASISGTGSKIIITPHKKSAIKSGLKDVSVTIIGEYGYPKLLAAVVHHSGGISEVPVITGYSNRVVDGKTLWGNTFYDINDNLIPGVNGNTFDAPFTLPVGQFRDITKVELVVKDSSYKSFVKASAFLFDPVDEPVIERINNINISGNTVESVSITSTTRSQGKVLTAIYSGEALISVKIVDLSEESYEGSVALVPVGLEIPDGAERISAFVWDGVGSIMPLMENL